MANSNSSAVAPPSAKTSNCVATIGKQIETIKGLASGPPEVLNLKNPKVSQWTVAQHVDHTINAAKMIFGLIFMLMQAKGAKAGGKPKFLARVVMATGYIPRGKGKSPEQLMPGKDSIAEIAKNLPLLEMAVKGVTGRLADVDGCQSRAPHPALGDFTPAEWLRFVEIHTNHHLKIIRDIQKG